MVRFAVATVAVACLGSPALAQSTRPYTEGPVTEVSYIRTKPGKFDEYLKYVQGPYKAYLEALKKDGIVLGYQVYSSESRGPEDWDVLLTVSYRNLAALDGLDERTDSVAMRVFGSEQQRSQATVDRGSLREVLGTRLLRELLLK